MPAKANANGETKNAPPPRKNADRGHKRVTADTVVTEGPQGMDRFKGLLKRMLKVPKDRLHLFWFW